MTWPPKIGEPLPRAELAWCDPIKLGDWVLGAAGHGREWERTLRVRAEDSALVWAAIAEATVGAVIYVVHDRKPFGIACGVMVDITIGGRMAPAILSWHYSNPDAAPRLVTAYPNI